MIDISQVENLVFEGGGVKAFAFIGVMEYLEEKGLLPNIKRVIGSSAGCIFATVVATKMSVQAIKSILQDTDFSTFKDDSWGYIPDIFRVWNAYGFCRGDELYEWFGDVLRISTGSPDITFLDLYHKTGIELVITGTNLNKATTEYFSYETRPDMPVRLAMRISTSIPLFFKAVQFEGDVWVDGGTLNPYPIWYFDSNAGIRSTTLEDLVGIKKESHISKTMGFKLLSSDEIVQDGDICGTKKNITNIKNYTFALIDAVYFQIERGYIKDDFWQRTVPVYVGNTRTTDFDMPKEKIDQLIARGKESIVKFFD